MAGFAKAAFGDESPRFANKEKTAADPFRAVSRIAIARREQCEL
jgi:hypothetical protein